MEHYQIVNIREILRRKEGTVYKGEIGVFVSKDAKNFSLSNDSPVYVNAFSYALVIKGNACLSIDETIYRLSSDTLCVLSPLHLTSFFDISDDFECIFLCSHKDFIDKIGMFNLEQRIVKGISMHTNPVLFLHSCDAIILRECMMNVGAQIQREEHLYHLELIQNSLVRFYLELDNILDRTKAPDTDGMNISITQNQLKLQEFIVLLMSYFKTQHNVAFYADALHITPQYLTKIVKSKTGKTVRAFIFELIYSEARNLLSSTDFSIQQIAGLLNFADQASFSKFFKRNSGMSPLDFRETVLSRSKK